MPEFTDKPSRKFHPLLPGTIIAALLIVGAVSDGIVRHIVQTAPLWIVVGMGVRRSGLTKWAALPMFVIWLGVMLAIWLYLLGLARITTGQFSPVEILMTLIIGASCVVGIVTFWRTSPRMTWIAKISILAAAAVLQVAAIAISLQPPIASDTALRMWIESEF